MFTTLAYTAVNSTSSMQKIRGVTTHIYMLLSSTPYLLQEIKIINTNIHIIIYNVCTLYGDHFKTKKAAFNTAMYCILCVF